MGDFESARSKLKMALDLDPRNIYCQKVLKKIEEMIELGNAKGFNEKIVEASNRHENNNSKRYSRYCFCLMF